MSLQLGRPHVPGIHPGRIRAAALSAALTAQCLRGLAAPGYVAQLDAVFGPAPGPVVAGLGTPMSLVMHGLHAALGGALLGRLCIAGTFFLASFAPMVLLENRPWLVQLPAGLLGALNPWTYDRMVEGQWGVVLAGACLFLWLAAWNALQEQPGWRTSARLAAISVAIIVVSDAFAGILVVLAGAAALGTRVWTHRERLRWSAIALLMWLAMAIADALPFFLGRGLRTFASVQTFGRADFEAFRSVADRHIGLLPNLAGLYGFWGEGLSRFPLPKDGAGWWPISAAVVVGFALMGAIVVRERAWLMAAAMVGIVVSASTATDWGLRAVTAVAGHVPLLASYREPQKWLALWLVALVVLSAASVEWAMGRSADTAAHDDAKLDAPPGYGPMMLAGILTMAVLIPNGLFMASELPQRITPVTYPPSWYSAAAFLKAHARDGDSIVVLPWHLYQPLPFADGRLTANPAEAFFAGNLVVPDNPELPGSQTGSSPGDIGAIDAQQSDEGCRLGDALRAQDIHWVVMETNPGSIIDTDVLHRCGYRIVEGENLDLTILHG